MHVRFTNDVCPTKSQAIDKCSTIPAPIKINICTMYQPSFHQFISTKCMLDSQTMFAQQDHRQ